MRSLSAAAFTAIVALSTLGTTGCGALTRAKECKELVTTINTGVTALDAIGKAKTGSDPASVAQNLRKMADAYERLAADTAKVGVTTAALKTQATTYGGLAKKSAQAARDFALAIDAKDAQKARAAEKEFDKLADEEAKLVEAMNKTCQGG